MLRPKSNHLLRYSHAKHYCRCGRLIQSRRKDWEDPPATAPVGVQRVHMKGVEHAYDQFAAGDKDFEFKEPPIRTVFDQRKEQWEIWSPRRASYMKLIYRPDEKEWYYKGRRGHVEPIAGLLDAYHWIEKLF